MLISRADGNRTDGDGETPLHVAPKTNEFQIMHYLVERGAEPRKTHRDGKTHLVTAEQHTKTKRRQDDALAIYLSVGGLTSRVKGPNEHLKWAKRRPLQVGDKVEVEVFEANTVDVPTDRQPAEREEERERLRYEDAKETYLA